jgi:triacylglycerol lipase
MNKKQNWGRKPAAWTISMLNGMYGDSLQEHSSGLALEMAFYQQGRSLRLECDTLRTAHSQPMRKVCVLIHGLGCNEFLWQFKAPASFMAAPGTKVDYGQLLHDEFGYTPFYVRYNTGLAVAENGRSLARLLDTLYACYPVPIEQILLIGHSMGGLVVRSACHYGTQQGERWVEQVKQVFYLGTPHDGADLERWAQNTEDALQAAHNPISRLIGNVFNGRSQGIKDLRYGTLVTPDVIDEGWDDVEHHQRRAVPWLAHAKHYLIGGTLTCDPANVVSVLLGDGLVCPPHNMDNAIPNENIRLVLGVRHLQLARNWEVYQQLAAWCRAEENPQRKVAAKRMGQAPRLSLGKSIMAT